MSSSLRLRRLVVTAFLVATFVWIGSVIAAEKLPHLSTRRRSTSNCRKISSGKRANPVPPLMLSPAIQTNRLYAVLTKWHAGPPAVRTSIKMTALSKFFREPGGQYQR
jgi:hypothetical protein